MLLHEDQHATHIRAEVLQRESLNGVNAQLRVGLDNRKASRHYPIAQQSARDFLLMKNSHAKLTQFQDAKKPGL